MGYVVMVTADPDGGSYAQELREFGFRVTVMDSVDIERATALIIPKGSIFPEFVALEAKTALNCKGGTRTLRRFLRVVREAVVKTIGVRPIVALYCPQQLNKREKERLSLMDPFGEREKKRRSLMDPPVDVIVYWPARPSDLHLRIRALESYR